MIRRLAQPKKQPMKGCNKCGASNEGWRTRCVGCGANV